MRGCLAIGFFGMLGTTNALSRSGCLCTSDQPCWPSVAAFGQLESQLSQPLVYPSPSASAYYPPSAPSGNCTDVEVNWTDGNWRADHPGSMEMLSWETFTFPNGTIDACYLNTSMTGMCGQGSVPTIGVDARSVADIQVALGFAVQYGLKTVVKNTGHDFAGRSAARGAFQLWTHHMKNITYDAAFVPRGAPKTETYEALTIGAGVQWGEAYAAASQHGRMMVGGISAGGSVGAAGGWLAGGGYSFLSPTHGLGVDNALEISIVLSTGEYLITNEYQNSDLFWALRGGGGGTYGIVTSVTYRTYPAVPLQLWFYQGNATNSSALVELVEKHLHFQVQLTDDGWGGYAELSAQGLGFTYFGPNMTNETVVATTEGWRNFTQSLASSGVSSSEVFTSLSWDFLLSQLSPKNVWEASGINLMLTSRLLSRDTIATNASQVAKVLVDCRGGFSPIAGGKVNQFTPDSAGVHPAWRSAVSHAVCPTSWNQGASSKVIQDVIQIFQEQTQALSDAAPEAGAYLNEASPYEVDWQTTFFGAHYPKLRNIKDKYDPYRLFAVRQGVGSDDWNKNLTCRF